MEEHVADRHDDSLGRLLKHSVRQSDRVPSDRYMALSFLSGTSQKRWVCNWFPFKAAGKKKTKTSNKDEPPILILGFAGEAERRPPAMFFSSSFFSQFQPARGRFVGNFTA